MIGKRKLKTDIHIIFTQQPFDWFFVGNKTLKRKPSPNCGITVHTNETHEQVELQKNILNKN